MKKKIMYITGTRADYGRMRPLLKRLEESNEIDLKIIATGMHLKKEFGSTYKIVKDDFNEKVTLYDSYDLEEYSDQTLMPNSIASMIKFFSHYIKIEKIKYMILFGDRGEMLAAAIAASHFGVEIFHIAGGDFSGSIDDKYRDAISIFSKYHFVALKEHRDKLHSMRIKKDNIFLAGALDISSLIEVRDIDINGFLEQRNIDLSREYCILIYHADVFDNDIIMDDLKNIYTFLNQIDINVIVISPNSDYGKDIISSFYSKIKNQNFYFFENINYEIFINLLKKSKFIIGNSSAGVIEASYTLTPSINIGKRQENRIKGKNLITVEYKKNPILEKYKIIVSKKYKKEILKTKYLYGNGDSVIMIFKKIIEIIKKGRN